MQKTLVALMFGLFLIIPVSAIDIQEAQEQMRIREVTAILVPVSPTNENVATPTKRGSGRIACTTSYGSPDGKHIMLRPVIVTKKYNSMGKTAYRDIEVYGSKCKFKVNNIREVRGKIVDMSPHIQREIIVK